MKSLLTSAFPCVLAFAFSVMFSCNNETDTTTTTDSSAITTGDSLDRTPTDTGTAALATHAEARLSGTSPDTSVTGTVRFDAADGKVKMVLDISVPTKAGKEVAVHIHEHGDCGDKGNMAHGHWNPTNANHGKWGSAAFHAGDIGNVKLDGTGKGSLNLETELWSIGGSADKNILGKAIIVHGGVDDYKTQPTGNAGSRIGCGVIQ